MQTFVARPAFYESNLQACIWKRRRSSPAYHALRLFTVLCARSDAHCALTVSLVFARHRGAATFRAKVLGACITQSRACARAHDRIQRVMWAHTRSCCQDSEGYSEVELVSPEYDASHTERRKPPNHSRSTRRVSMRPSSKKHTSGRKQIDLKAVQALDGLAPIVPASTSFADTIRSQYTGSNDPSHGLHDEEQVQ
jgi:hypothetical protein